MRIAFDAKRMLNNSTGLGNHARILLQSMMRDYPSHEYLLFSPRAREEYVYGMHGGFHLHFPEGKWARLLHPLWRSYGITDDLIRHNADLYHGLSNELPLNIHRSVIRTVVTIHDLIFLKHKEQYPWADRRIYTLKTKYAARHAGKIIAVSQETKQDLMEMYGVPERNITVIYQSADERFWRRVPEDVKAAVAQRHQLSRRFILNVGSFFPRKNQTRLIEAYDRIKGQIEEDLVLVGNPGGLLPDIRKLITAKKLDHRVHILTDIRTDELPALYQSAGLFVYPSLFEGFGVPVLEALISGVPVVASRGGAIAEAAGTGSVFTDPRDIDEMAARMLSVLADTTLRGKMTASGYLHAESMTDKMFAAKTMELYLK